MLFQVTFSYLLVLIVRWYRSVFKDNKYFGVSCCSVKVWARYLHFYASWSPTNVFIVVHMRRRVFFGSPELKTQMSFSDYLLCVVRLSVRPSVYKLFTSSSSSQKTTGPISDKLGTQHPWAKGIQVCSNEGPFKISKKRKYIDEI